LTFSDTQGHFSYSKSLVELNDDVNVAVRWQFHVPLLLTVTWLNEHHAAGLFSGLYGHTSDVCDGVSFWRQSVTYGSSSAVRRLSLAGDLFATV